MRRKIRKQFLVNEIEANELANKARMACLDESSLIRELIHGYEPTAKPGESFYKFTDRLNDIADNLQRIADVAYSTRSIDADDYQRQMEKIHMLVADIEEEMFINKESEIWKGNNL